MDIDTITQNLAGVPHMTPEQGRLIYDLVLKEKPVKVFELGFRHGVSSSYISLALSHLPDIGRRLTTMDLEGARTAEPNIEQLLSEFGLRKYVDVVYCPESYIWELSLMVSSSTSSFDFCFIDGAHSLETDGLAFFLVNSLLKPGGFILFDDLDWTFAKSPTLKNSDRVRAMTIREKQTPQIRFLYENLVMTHPDYSEFRQFNGWASARKHPKPSY